MSTEMSNMNVASSSSYDPNLSAKMEPRIQNLKANNVTNPMVIVQSLMEGAETLSADGQTKRNLVIEAFTKLVHWSNSTGKLGNISIDTVQTIVDAFIYATRNAININNAITQSTSTGGSATTGCLAFFKKCVSGNSESTQTQTTPTTPTTQRTQ